MPGNEASDKLFNFFEQESLPHKQPSSQAASVNWSVPGNNPQVLNQGEIEPALDSDTKNYNIQFSDSEVGNNHQSPQTLFQTNNAQLPLKPDFAKSHFRNQELSLNGFDNGNQSLQNRYNHTELLRLKEVSDQYKLNSRRSSVIEQQRGDAPEHSSVLARTSERLETTRNPISFAPLNQQQLMNTQQPSMSQPQSRQQTGGGDMQLWQQQILFNQLQELQRQKQLQQLQQDGRHQNQLNQLSAFAKQAANSQLPAIVNGTPIDGSSNFSWQNELPGGDSTASNSSQMFLVGNPNWAHRGGYSAVQGIPDGLLSNEQAQMLRSVGLVPQQLNQSVYASHNPNTRDAFNQYSNQGLSQDYANTLIKANINHSEKPLMQFANSLHGGQSALFSNPSMQDGASVSRQGFQGKTFLGQIPFQGISSGVQPGNHMQVNSVSGNAPMQEFQGREQQAGWSGGLQERAPSHIGSSQGMVSLDPTEKKILFSSDDNIWDAPSGKAGITGVGGYGNLLEREEDLNVFPSIQSGTWSALMQSAVAEASSSEAGLQDEWSGLSFHNRESSTVDQPLALGDTAKPQPDWVDTNLHTSSLTSKSFPLFDDGKMSKNGQNVFNFQKPTTKNIYGQGERMQHGASYESIQQSLNDRGKCLDLSSQQMHITEGNHQGQHPMNSENAFQRDWTKQTPSESAANATNAPLDDHNMQVSWVHQHGIAIHNTKNQNSSNSTGWNNNKSLSDCGEAMLRSSEIDHCRQGSQRNDLRMGVESDRDGRLMTTNSSPNFVDNRGSHRIRREASFTNNGTATPISNTTKPFLESNQLVQNNNHLNLRRHMFDSPVNHRDDSMGCNQNSLSSQVLEASIHNSDRGSGETYDKKRENSYQKEFSNDSYNSNQSQPTVTGGGLRENSWLSTSDSRPMAGANHPTAQVGCKAPVHRRFQYHPMGSVESNLEARDTSKRVMHMQSLAQQSFHEPRGHEVEPIRQPELLNHASSNTIFMGKEQMSDFQRSERGSASSDGSAGIPQSSRTVRTCQNMLELFHNVDRSTEHSSPARFNSSDRNASSEVPEADCSEASVVHKWHQQSTASQGFGLRLAPPTERLPFTNRVLNSQNSSQTINNLNSRLPNSNIEERSKRCSAPVSSGQSFPREISQREHWDNTTNISEQTGKETSQLNVQANLSAAHASSLLYSRHQQSKQISRINEKIMNDNLASNYRQPHVTYGEVANDQSVQVSMPGTTGRSSQIASPSDDTSQPEGSSGSHASLSGQPFPILESVPISRPSSVSGRSQQDEFSKMHHVRSNISSQQHLTGGPPNKVSHNLSQSSSPSNSILEKTLFASQKREHDETKKGGNHPDFGSFSSNLRPTAYGQNSWKHRQTLEKVDQTPHGSGTSVGQESAIEHYVGTESIAPAPVVSHPHQQEVHRGRHWKDPAMVCLQENSSSRNSSTSTRDIEAFGRSLMQANQNYSLLHQVQAMKGMGIDLDKRGGKRYKVADAEADAPQLAYREGPQAIDARNVIARELLNSDQNAAVQHASFTSCDGKMLSFSSEGRGNQSLNTASQMVLGDVSSQDKATFGQNDSHYSELTVPSVRHENPQINPKMAPTWFDRYGTFRPEQSRPMQDAQGTVKPILQQFHFGKESEGLNTYSSNEQVNTVDTSQIEAVCQDSVASVAHSDGLTHSQSLPSEFTHQTLVVVRPKKRKIETSMHLPWHKEIVSGSQRLPTISMSEKVWAQTANRLVEKMEDETELVDDGQQMIRPRRRLIYTTQLMQQIFCPAPAEFLSSRVTSDYESVVYSVAKLALGEACSLISSPGSDSYLPVVNENRESGECRAPKLAGDQYFSMVAENFIGKAKKLEIDLLRLDKRVSVLDLRVECQDLERFSVINRFAKFHVRSQADCAENSVLTTQKTFLQRYVTARAISGSPPGGVECLSL